MTAVQTRERDELLRRYYAREPALDGSFLIAVRTTGIYCLPSCRAKSPRPENVRVFAGEDEARAAGFRACKRCRPTDFYRRHDPERERVRALAAEVRRAPAEFADTLALARRAGLGATKLNALFRKHFHLTPAEYLVRARVRAAAAALFADGASVLAAGAVSGFESASAFHANFRAKTGMTPAAYRALGSEPAFRVRLPPRFERAELADLFARDAGGNSERVAGTRMEKALLLEGRPVRIALAFAPGSVLVHVEGERRLPRAAFRAAHERVARWLALESEPAAFERRAARSPEIARLVRGREGLRIPRSTDLFEGLVWVVVGAQVNIAFASACRAAVIELAGTPIGDMRAHPAPADVARLDYADLERRAFSRRKAEYLVDAARALALGTLDLEALRDEPVTLVQERLAGVRGLGPWSVNYLGMRSFGFEDCAPIGDVALAEALKRFHARAARPTDDEAARLMEPFAPHRSLATRHLWRSLAS